MIVWSDLQILSFRQLTVRRLITGYRYSLYLPLDSAQVM